TPQTAAPGAVLFADGLVRPGGIAIDSNGAVRVAARDEGVQVGDGTPTVLAGTGDSGFSGDGKSAKLAELALDVFPETTAQGLAVDPLGNGYIAGYCDHGGRSVSTDGDI